MGGGWYFTNKLWATKKTSVDNSTNQNGYTITDLFVLKSLLEVVNNSKENLEWVLQKQNQLRVEYLTFFKKDLKEIQGSLSELFTSNNTIIETIVKEYREDILKSFAIVDVRYQKVLTTEQTIDKVIAGLSEDMKKFSEEKNKQFQEIKGLSDGLVNLLKEQYDQDGNESLHALIKGLKDITHGNE